MPKKNITIETLAVMVKKGFDETAKKAEMDSRFKAMDKRFDMMDKRFDRIENVLLRQHSEDIQYLKERVSKLEEALALE